MKRWRRRKPDYARIGRLESELGYEPMGSPSGQPNQGQPSSPFSGITAMYQSMYEMEAKIARRQRHALILKRGPLTDEESRILGVRNRVVTSGDNQHGRLA